jgi:hypothetical protein
MEWHDHLLPIFRIRPTDDHFRDYIVRAWLWNGRVDDLDDGPLVDDCFFHLDSV